MEDKIIQFIKRYIDLSDAEADIVRDSSHIESFKKNDILLSEGEYSKNHYFILKGCVRTYYIIDGNEKTTEFYTENQSIVPASMVTKEPSEYFISCLEDCTIAIGSEERDLVLIERIPKLKNLIMKSDIQVRIHNQVMFDNFKSKTPEMRYHFLLDTRPDLFNRVPLHQLATYLGITPVSLSRMRKRISTKR
ncbi:MAG: putative transcriptional regulator, Crp/Fnr family [Flaviaesturariibacter sp.]|nr:putative transcriptional regulator, Crp/Fnr family [Flaviaesturariibacter sp.]